MSETPDREPRCDHICMLDDGHTERGEPHQYGYEVPSPRQAAGVAAAPQATLDQVLEHVADWDPERDVYYGINEDLSPGYREAIGMVPVYRWVVAVPTDGPRMMQSIWPSRVGESTHVIDDEPVGDTDHEPALAEFSRQRPGHPDPDHVPPEITGMGDTDHEDQP